MRKLITLLVFALCMNVAFVSAKELGPKKTYSMTVTELSYLLNPTAPVEELESDVVVEVKVLITEKHEMIVLNTDTTNKTLTTYIENNLNFVKLSAKELVPGNKYVLKIKFKA